MLVSSWFSSSKPLIPCSLSMQERDEPGMPSLKEIPHVHFLNACTGIVSTVTRWLKCLMQVRTRLSLADYGLSKTTGQLYKEKIAWCKSSVIVPSCWNIHHFDQRSISSLPSSRRKFRDEAYSRRFSRPAQALLLGPRIAFLDQTTLPKCVAALKMRNMLVRAHICVPWKNYTHQHL